MDLRNASALVTGGAGGFGAACVRRLHAAGAKVVIADLAGERGEALAKELGGGSRYVETNVLDEDSVRNAVNVASEMGPLRVNIIVHGGGSAGARIIGRDGKRYPYETFKKTVDIFLNATYNVMSLCAEAMAQTEPLDSGQRGVVISTASIAGFEGQVGQSDYSAAKGGVIGFTLTAARDLAPLGIRVMCIAPGTFLTLAYRGDPDEIQAKWGPTVPNPKRMGLPDEYAQLAMQICENDYLNGTVIRIDGAQRFGLK